MTKICSSSSPASSYGVGAYRTGSVLKSNPDLTAFRNPDPVLKSIRILIKARDLYIGFCVKFGH